MNYTKNLYNLGELDPQQKETMWKDTVSGSQSWKLINEPYNLLSEKLIGKTRFESKYDFFNSETQKAKGKQRMDLGNHFEKLVFETHIKHQDKNPNAERKNETYQLDLVDENNKIILSITSTPDWYEKEFNKDGSVRFNIVGDIKCTKQASDGEIMSERYYFQILHNCYVLDCYNGEINAKNGITEDIYNWKFEFSIEDFKAYEKKLIEFYTAWKNNQIDYYDDLYYQKEQAKQKVKLTFDADSVEYNEIRTLTQIKKQIAELEQQAKAIEDKYKNNYENAELDFQDYQVAISSLERKGSVDYKAYFYQVSQEFKVPFGYENKFRKPSTTYKVIKIKANQGE